MKLFFFDTETTGLNPGVDRIIQFGGIFGIFDEKTFEFKETQRVNQLINVDVKIPSEVSAIHGIQKKDLEGFGYMDEYIYEFLALIKKADFVIGHNIFFDRDMIQGETKILGIPFDFSKIKLIDTMRTTAELVNGKGGKWPRLIDLHKFLFGREFDDAHNAMADIEATKNCFIELVKKYDFYDDFFPKKIDLNDTDNIHVLKDNQLEQLYRYEGRHLSLNGLTSITDKQIDLIALLFKGESLSFDGLTEITDKQAELLLRFRGKKISLNGLSTITDKQAEYLIQDFCGRSCRWGDSIYSYYYPNEVSLDGLVRITDKQAKLFSSMEGKDYLYLSIKEITDKQAEIFSKFGGDKLALDGLEKLTDKQLKILSSFFGFSMSLCGLKNITDEQAEILAGSNAEVLYLNGLLTITDKQAENLSKYDGSELFLEGLESITKKQNEILSHYKGELHLNEKINIL